MRKKIKGAVKARKVFTFLISNENINIIKIVQSLEKSGLLIDGATEIVKHEMKKQEDRFIDCTNGFFIDIPYSFFIDK